MILPKGISGTMYEPPVALKSRTPLLIACHSLVAGQTDPAGLAVQVKRPPLALLIKSANSFSEIEIGIPGGRQLCPTQWIAFGFASAA
jgi:hypothetical protein